MSKQIDSLNYEDSTSAGRKIVQLMQALEEVVASMEQQHSPRAQLDAHRWLWVLPALLLVAPCDPAGGDHDDDDPDASTGFRGQAALMDVFRNRLKHAQEEDWEPLLEAHQRRLERNRRRAARTTSSCRWRSRARA